MKKADLVTDLTLYAALFKDIAAWDSGLHTSLAKDFSYLEKMVATRGISFIMIDMPDADKVINHSYATGWFDARKLPHTFGVLRGSHREFLSGLTRQIFDHQGFLFPDVDPSAAFFLGQVLNLAKKVKEDCSDAAILAEVDAFRDIDSSLRNPSLNWESDRLVFPSKRLSITDGYRAQSDLVSRRDECPLLLLQVAQATADIVIGQYPAVDRWGLKPRHGPGAVADAKSGTDKYQFQSWPRKLDEFFNFESYSQVREDLHLTDASVPIVPYESPARLIAVPKTLKAPRMIASEPVAHQYLQLGMMRWLRDNMPPTISRSIDFRNQKKSQDFCLVASTSDDYATVDLSSASDRLSCWLVERLFRANPSMIEAFHACRTRYLVNATGHGESYLLRLKKYAPMGNGTTFPVQTIVYTILGIACLIFERKLRPSAKTIRRLSREIRVFGDDIIIPSSAVFSLTQLLSHLDFRVNLAKTFASGRYRESCGMVAFQGVDITPLRLSSLSLREGSENLTSWVAISNNAYLKGLWCLSDAMIRAIPPKILRLIPISKEDPGSLFLCTMQSGYAPAGSRFNRKLQRMEVQGLTPVSKPMKRHRDNHQSLLQYFLEAPLPDYLGISPIWEAGYVVKVRFQLRKRWVPVG